MTRASFSSTVGWDGPTSFAHRLPAEDAENAKMYALCHNLLTMPAHMHISVRERVNLMPLDPAAFLLALPDHESALEGMKSVAVDALHAGRRLSGVVRARKKDRTVEIDGEGQAESPETGAEHISQRAEEGDQAEREVFDRRLKVHLAKGEDTCRKELLGRLFDIAGQDHDSRHERPLLKMPQKPVALRLPIRSWIRICFISLSHECYRICSSALR